MVVAKDIIAVAVDEHIVARANTYAKQSLNFTYDRMHLKNPSLRFRNIVLGKIMEGALEQLLKEKNISFDKLGETHYTQIDKYDIGINGHRCDIKGFFLRSRSAQHALQTDVAWLLDCCALVPTDQLCSETLKMDDYYIFAFMTANIENRNIENQLHSIIVHNGVVYFCGYITKKEFQSASTHIPVGYTMCKQYTATKTKNNMMKIYSLHSMSGLFSHYN